MLINTRRHSAVVHPAVDPSGIACLKVGTPGTMKGIRLFFLDAALHNIALNPASSMQYTAHAQICIDRRQMSGMCKADFPMVLDFPAKKALACDAEA